MSTAIAHAMPTTAIADAALGGTVVVKLGGRSFEHPESRAALVDALASLAASGCHLVVCHGGGAQVTRALDAAGIASEFVGGLRVTTRAALAVAEPVFTALGKELAHALTAAGVPAVGLTGRDAGLLAGVVKDAALGRVGSVTGVDASLLRHLYFNGLTPVLSPIAVDDAGALNVNADEVAASVAAALGARHLVLLTDVDGVRDATGATVDALTTTDALALIDAGVATGGMIPKIRGAVAAVDAGVRNVHVVSGQTPHALAALAEGARAGTTITRGDAA